MRLALKLTAVWVCLLVTTTEINWWNRAIPANLDFALIPLTSSILPPVFTITNDPNAFPAGLSCPPVTRTIHPPPWPYVTPDPGSSSEGGPPVYITYSSSASRGGGGGGGGGGSNPTCPNCKHGTRCIGLYCNAPGQLPSPDPDYGDPKNPENPYDPDDPYEPEDEQCTTQPYTSCETACIAGATPSTCSSSCSTSFTCSGEDISTIGTQTLAGWGTMEEEMWPTATPDAAYVSSVLAAVQSRLSSWYPKPTTTSTPPVPTGTMYSNLYRFYYWDCHTPFTNTRSYRVGKSSDGACGSRGNKLDESGRPYTGTTYDFCGISRELGDPYSGAGSSMCMPVEHTGGYCCSLADSSETTCRNEDDVECTVTAQYACTDRCNE